MKQPTFPQLVSAIDLVTEIDKSATSMEDFVAQKEARYQEVMAAEATLASVNRGVDYQRSIYRDLLDFGRDHRDRVWISVMSSMAIRFWDQQAWS